MKKLKLFLLLIIISLPLTITNRYLHAQSGSQTQSGDLSASLPPFPLPSPNQAFGYGLGVAQPNDLSVLQMGFTWMAMYELPNRRMATNVLYRLPVNRWSIKDGDDWYERNLYEQTLHRQLTGYENRIEAYEIGNEVNLYIDGWEAPPNAAKYAELLCMSSRTIKRLDPTAVIVSAGLAPVGRVVGNWQGHAGHSYRQQDEQQYLRELIAAGGLDCVDAVGYHPMGFSANYDTAPGVADANPAQNCTNDFCFRGVERIQQILQETGYGHKQIWATEVGWIAQAAEANCGSDYSWEGRGWQAVTAQKQAENLVGAFHYAEQNWPWLGAIFVFNLNFNQAPYYHACEQMRSYSVMDSPAQTALINMPKSVQVHFQYLPFAPHNGR